ncbi:MAG: ABC transporter substrate-binding protein [Acidimicrobiales bacterium]
MVGGSAQASAKTSHHHAKTVTITFANWAAAETATEPGISKLISEFEATHKNIKVNSLPVSFTTIGHQLVLEEQSGNLPDVAEISGNTTFALAATGAVASLKHYLTKHVKHEYLASEFPLSTYKGQVIALPWTVNPPGLWYNKTLMKGAGLNPNDPPKTMSQLLSDCAAIHAKYPTDIPLGLDTTSRSFALSADWPWMKAFGAQPFKGTTATADTKGMKSYLSFMRELAKKGYIVPDQKIGAFRPQAALNEVAFDWDQPVLQGVVQSDNHESTAQFFANWGVTTLPTKTAKSKSYSVELGHQLIMFKSSKHQKQDFTFMNWLASNTTAVIQYTVPYESSLPALAHPTSAIITAIKTPVLNSFLNTVLPTETKLPYGPSFSNAYSPIMAGVESAITSTTSITTIASTIQSGLQTAL